MRGKAPKTLEEARDELLLSMAEWINEVSGDAEKSVRFKKKFLKFKELKREQNS